MRTDEISSGLSAIAAKGTAFFTGLGMRLLVHFSSLVAAGIIGSTFSLPGGVPWGTSASVVAAAYIGLICLLPKGMGKTASWMVPTALGFFQCLFWAFWGVPWQFTFLWGGILTWGVRLLHKKADMGWEWSVAPWMLMAIFGFFSDLMPLTAVSVPFWTLPPLALAGWGTLLLRARLNYEPLHRQLLASACERMENLLSVQALPESLAKPVKLAVEQGRGFDRALPRLDTADAALIVDIDVVASKLSRYGAPSGLWTDDTGELVAETSRLNKRLRERLRELTKPDQSLDQALAARIDEFHKKALSLATRKSSLPPDMHTRIDGIVEATENILACMHADPNDVAPADKFLSRYLTAAHTVVEEYVRLSGQGNMHSGVTQALARSGELLKRLEQAFVDEHARLLQNDTVNFTAELNVLDKLLKMEGR